MAELPKITPAYLAEAERMARKILAEENECSPHAAKVGGLIIFVNAGHQVAMVERIRRLEHLVHQACNLGDRLAGLECDSGAEEEFASIRAEAVVS